MKEGLSSVFDHAVQIRGGIGLCHFRIPFDVRIVQVNRLHILQRFHDHLARQEAGKTPECAAWRGWLLRAFAARVRIPPPRTVDDRVWRSLTPVAGLSHCAAALGIGANSTGTQL